MRITSSVRNTAPQMFARLRAQGPQAIVRATNRAAVAARTAMLPPIAQDLGLKQKDVRDDPKYGLRVRDATIGRPVARLSASLKRIPLIDFGAKAARGKGKGVTARIGGKSTTYPHAFIVTVGTGQHRGVFQRIVPSRKRTKWGEHALPIRELRGPSLGHVFLKFRELGRQKAIAALVTNLKSQLRFALNGRG